MGHQASVLTFPLLPRAGMVRMTVRTNVLSSLMSQAVDCDADGAPPAQLAGRPRRRILSKHQRRVLGGR